MEALKASLAKKPEKGTAPKAAGAATASAGARKPAKRAAGRTASMRSESGRRS